MKKKLVQIESLRSERKRSSIVVLKKSSHLKITKAIEELRVWIVSCFFCFPSSISFEMVNSFFSLRIIFRFLWYSNDSPDEQVTFSSQKKILKEINIMK